MITIKTKKSETDRHRFYCYHDNNTNRQKCFIVIMITINTRKAKPTEIDFIVIMITIKTDRN